MRIRGDAGLAVVASQGLWLNTILLALCFGLCCGLALLFATFLSLAVTGEEAGLYLNLLGVFMPGYTATPLGAWIGFFWGFGYAAISGGVLYQTYIRAAGPLGGGEVVQGVARLSGLALGLSLGLLLALQLFFSSAWLVIRGTASESGRAALLSNYLPGYSVSWGGALLGAFWLFLYTLSFSLLFAFIYNAIARWRSEGSRSNAKSS